MSEELEKTGGEAPEEQSEKEGLAGSLYYWLQALVVALAVLIVVFTFFGRIIGVVGHSMDNTLNNGEILILQSIGYTPKQGDIIVLNKYTSPVLEGKAIVKRCIAVGGQTVDIDFSEGVVYVDGEALEEDYIREPTYTAEGTELPLTVPEGSIFVMGDNRNGSSDSRDYRLGTVDTRYVIGKAAFLLFPGLDYDTEKRNFSRIGVIW